MSSSSPPRPSGSRQLIWPGVRRLVEECHGGLDANVSDRVEVLVRCQRLGLANLPEDTTAPLVQEALDLWQRRHGNHRIKVRHNLPDIGGYEMRYKDARSVLGQLSMAVILCAIGAIRHFSLQDNFRVVHPREFEKLRDVPGSRLPPSWNYYSLDEIRVMPIRDQARDHWFLVIIRPKDDTYFVLDSRYPSRPDNDASLEIVADLIRATWRRNFERSPIQSPLQVNATDCGLWVIEHFRSSCRGISTVPTRVSHLNRAMILYEILAHESGVRSLLDSHEFARNNLRYPRLSSTELTLADHNDIFASLESQT